MLDRETTADLLDPEKATELVDQDKSRREQEQDLEQMEEQHQIEQQVVEFPHRCRLFHTWFRCRLMDRKELRPGLCTRSCEPRLIFGVVLVTPSIYICTYPAPYKILCDCI